MTEEEEVEAENTTPAWGRGVRESCRSQGCCFLGAKSLTTPNETVITSVETTLPGADMDRGGGSVGPYKNKQRDRELSDAAWPSQQCGLSAYLPESSWTHAARDRRARTASFPQVRKTRSLMLTSLWKSDESIDEPMSC